MVDCCVESPLTKDVDSCKESRAEWSVVGRTKSPSPTLLGGIAVPAPSASASLEEPPFPLSASAQGRGSKASVPSPLPWAPPSQLPREPQPAPSELFAGGGSSHRLNSAVDFPASV